MKQYECFNATQVAKKVCELCNLKYTQDERKIWIEYCKEIKKSRYVSDYIDYEKYEEDEIKDVSIFLGYDRNTETFLVGVEE
jgi:hypothetical protein